MDEQVKQLAENLKKNGLAASMSEAIEKAKTILNVKCQKSDISQEKEIVQENQTIQKAPEQNIEAERPKANLDIDIKNENVPLKELMKEVNVAPEQVEAQEQEKVEDIKEEINEIKEDIEQAEQNPEKVEQVKEEIAQVKEEVNKIAETKTETQENKQDAEEDKFKEEKKVDLTKVFGNKGN